VFKRTAFIIFFFISFLIKAGNVEDLRELVLSSKLTLNEKREKIFKITETVQERESNGLIELSDSLIGVIGHQNILSEFLKLIKVVAFRKNKKGDDALAMLKTINCGDDVDLKYHTEYNKARIYLVMSDYNSALGYLLNNLDYFEKYKKEDRQQVIILGSISTCYRRMKMFDQSLTYVNRAIKLSEKTKDTLNMFDAYSSLAILYLDKFEYQRADTVYSRLERLVVNLKNQAKQSFYNNYAETCINLNQLDKAEKYINECYRISCLEKDTFWIGIALVNKGNIAVKRNDFAKATKLCKTGLEYFKTFKSLVWLKNTCQCLYESNLGAKNYKEALEYYQAERKYNDSILSEKNNREMTRKEMKFEYDKKEAEVRAIAKVEKEKTELKAEEDKKRLNLIIVSVIGGLLLVSVFSIFIYRSLRKNKHANKIITAQKHLVEEKQKEILDSIHYAKRIQQSLMPTEKYIERNVSKLKDKK
jgi:tetratricopeptide (TPR) repeat protein